MDAIWRSAVGLVREVVARLKSASFGRETSSWLASLNQKMLVLVRTFSYSTRNTLIHWCLATANYLQRAQAKAIAQSASARSMTQGVPRAIAVPAPTYPDFSRRQSPPPRVPAKLYSQPAPKTDELYYDDFDDAPTRVHNTIPFDDAPTSVYHPIPSRYDSRLSRQA